MPKQRIQKRGHSAATKRTSDNAGDSTDVGQKSEVAPHIGVRGETKCVSQTDVGAGGGVKQSSPQSIKESTTATPCEAVKESPDDGTSYSSSTQEIDEIQLWIISQNITPAQYFAFGMKLGFQPAKLEQVKHDYSHITEATFKLLVEWHGKQTEKHVDSLVKLLEEAGLKQKATIIAHSGWKTNYHSYSMNARLLTELQLRGAAEDMHMDNFVPVGLRLGLKYNKLAAIRHNCKGDIETAIFKMLSVWQGDQEERVDQPETLARVLNATELNNLANKIRGNHYGLTNGGNGMQFVPDEPDPSPKKVHSLTLDVSHKISSIQEEAQAVLQDLLRRKKWNKQHLETLQNLQKLFRRDEMYALREFRLASIHLFVSVNSQAALECLKQAIKSGHIGQQLAELLISPETKARYGGGVALDVIMDEESCSEWLQCIGKDGTLQKKMANWNKQEVKSWLTDVVQFPNDVIEKLEEVDGYMLMRYSMVDLKADLDVSAVNLRKLIYHREDHFAKEFEPVAMRKSEYSPLHMTKKRSMERHLTFPKMTITPSPSKIKKTTIKDPQLLSPTLRSKMLAWMP